VLVVAAGLACLSLAASIHGGKGAAAAAAAAAPPAAATIDWPAARRQARLDADGAGARYAGMLAGVRRKMSTIAIPVLLPAEAELASDLELFPNGAFYSASCSYEGMSVLVTGSGRAFAVSPRAAREAGGLPSPSPDGVSVTPTESGLEASFSRFGASYSVALDCRRPGDRRCAAPGYLRGLVSRMVVLIPGAAG
jgi:hypothetical protein